MKLSLRKCIPFFHNMSASSDLCVFIKVGFHLLPSSPLQLRPNQPPKSAVTAVEINMDTELIPSCHWLIRLGKVAD